MANGAHIGFPFTDNGPIVTERESRNGRLRFALQLAPREHKLRQDIGVPTKSALFNAGILALTYSMRVAVRETLSRIEPGVLIPPGEDGVTITEVPDPKRPGQTKHQLKVRYINQDLPAPEFDELEVRLRSGR